MPEVTEIMRRGFLWAAERKRFVDESIAKVKFYSGMGDSTPEWETVNKQSY